MAIEPIGLARDRSDVLPPAAAAPAPSDGSAPAASFIVCTRNRTAALQLCIRSIEEACASHPAFATELVVVDNGSTDDTAAVLARFAASSNVPVTAVSEPRRGLATARNAGIEQARGRILVFIDDDCTVDRSYLRDLERHYRGGERLVFRGGSVDLGDPDDLPFTIKRSSFRERLTPEVHPGGFVLGCNMTMHRDVVARVGRFDERFGAGGALRSAEDTDYIVRAFLLGIPVEYVPDMTVLHRHGRKTRRAVKALHRSYSLGNGGLCLKHIRDAPWLFRHFLWTVREAFRELWGGPHFHEELHLSHWPIVFMNLLGAAKFAVLLLVKREASEQVRRVEQAKVMP
jgi:glycosyltransferase involved in cell wall biosynthesis